MPYVSHNLGEQKKAILLAALNEYRSVTWPDDPEMTNTVIELWQKITKADAVMIVADHNAGRDYARRPAAPDEATRAAAGRLLNEVHLHTHEYQAHDYESDDHPDLIEDIETVARALLAERQDDGQAVEVERLRALLPELKVNHRHECTGIFSGCDCGADEHNAKIDEAIAGHGRGEEGQGS